MTCKALEISARRFPGGWDWKLRAYSVVSLDAKVVRFTIEGNIPGLEDLFASGQATPFDQVNTAAGGLLGVSMAFQNPSMSKV